MEYKISNRITPLPFSGIRAVMEKANQLERDGNKVIHLELGRPDFDTPTLIKEACKDSLNKGHVFYTSNYGNQELRERIANKLSFENKIPYHPKEILVTVGLSEAIYCVLGSLLDEGDEVLVPDPVWLNYLHVTKHFGGIPVTYNLKEANGFEIDFEEVLAKISNKTRVIVLISPNNPTGSVLKYSQLKKIAEIAKAKNILVISDEIYEKLIYDGFQHISIASLPGMKERTITLNGFSKAYSMTGWRIGYIAAPEPIIQACVRMHQYITACATSFVQDAAIVALDQGQESIQSMVTEYQRRRDYLVKTINSIKGLSCVKPRGAFYIFVNIKELKISSIDFANFLLEDAKIALVPGTAFGNSGEGYVRISYATSYDDIILACSRLTVSIEKIINN